MPATTTDSNSADKAIETTAAAKAMYRSPSGALVTWIEELSERQIEPSVPEPNPTPLLVSASLDRRLPDVPSVAGAPEGEAPALLASPAEGCFVQEPALGTFGICAMIVHHPLVCWTPPEQIHTITFAVLPHGSPS